MTARGIVLGVAGAALAAPFAFSTTSIAEEANPFDGAWNAEVVCPTSPSGQGYTWRLPVRIAEGTLSGIYHSPTTDAEGELSGWVRPDGKAIVSVIGQTGRDESIAHVRPGTRFRYTANVQFNGGSGSGQREQLRPCVLNFSRT
jgi:hypothetical protein